MRRILTNACAANSTPLVISNSGTNGGNRSHLDLLALDDEDDAEDDETEETLSDLSSANMFALYTKYKVFTQHQMSRQRGSEDDEGLPLGPVLFREFKTRHQPSLQHGEQEHTDTCAYHRTRTTRHPTKKPN